MSLSAGLFLLISAVWAGRLPQNTVAAIFGVFSAFWLSFGFLLIGLTSGWWAVHGDSSGQLRATYLLSWLLVFVLLTLSHAAAAAGVHGGLRARRHHVRVGALRRWP